MTRPYISKIQPWVWREPDGTPTPGVLIRCGPKIVAHLNPEEAAELSNQLIDLTENLEVNHES